MIHGSLFSGIGGFDYAAQQMGWENRFWCEWNPFGQKVLKYYHPKAIGYNDITKTDFTTHRGTIDVLTGGFPCQPYSLAGERLGKEDVRHLWPEMLRAIKEIQPGWVVGENVPGIITWSKGMVFNEVQTDLETAGYEVFPYVLPACGVNAPHKRERVWFIAHSNVSRNSTSESRINRDGQEKIIKRGQSFNEPSRPCGTWFTTNPERIGQQGQGWPIKSCNTKENRTWQANWAYDDSRWPLESPLCGRDDGLSTKLSGITLHDFRIESLKAYGNAIVPQVALQIFKSIQEYVNLYYYE